MSRKNIIIIAGAAVAVLAIILLVVLLSGGGAKTATVTGNFQSFSLSQGGVGEALTVEFSDGTTAEVALPEAEADGSTSYAGRKVSVKKENDVWTFVKFK